MNAFELVLPNARAQDPRGRAADKSWALLTASERCPRRLVSVKSLLVSVSRAMSFLALLLPTIALGAEITIAQVSPLSGPLALNGTANYIGAKAVFDRVNAEGGIRGAKIRFVSEDDQYKPELTVSLLQQVAHREKPVAFINLFGSANTAAVLKENVLEKLGIPAIGVTPGAESLRSPGSTLLFHLQAGDSAQLRRLVVHLATVGIPTAAVAYQDNTFGKSGLQFVETFAREVGVSLLGKVAVPIGADDLRASAAQLQKTRAAAYIMVLAPNSGASLVRDTRSSGDRTPIYGMSYVPVELVLAKAGREAAVGVALAQVTPNAFTDSDALVRSFKNTLKRFNALETEPNQLHLMGYIAATVAVEAIRNAGPSPTPARVAAAASKLRMDVDGYQVDFRSGNVGANYVNIGVIDHRGRLVY